MPVAYIALGANVGERRNNMRAALQMLPEPTVRVGTVSSLYETDAVTPDDEEQPMYLNAAACLDVDVGPAALLHAFKMIEAELGRDPDAPRWSPRPIDVDLLLYDEAVIDDEGLTVPHPWMQERAFVLIPLAEIAPDIVHPINGRTIAELAKEVGDVGVRKVEDTSWFEAKS
jgi:2-amino-4-hydroxy-6-hydroxymethyldihydropteridine diphosphokinase